MLETLNQLNKVRGVQGSLVVGRDGLVIASDFGMEANEGALGAVSSQILSSLQAALHRMNMGEFDRFMVSGTKGKILLVDAGSALLMVLLDKDVNIGLVGVEIKTAAEAIRQKVHL